MKKRILLIVVALLIITSSCTNIPTTTEDQDNKKPDEVPVTQTETLNGYKPVNVEVPYNPTVVEPKLAPYKVNSDLSNIENQEQFGAFSPQQLELLISNNFVVNPTKQEQLFYIYEDNMYNKMLPNFITTDSVLQVYHIFYNYTLRTLESERLIALSEQLTDTMLIDSINLYNEIEDESIKQAQLKNVAFFAVAQLVLERELPIEIPKEAKDMAEAEIMKINSHSGFERSSIFDFDLDYSQYIVRGHYTRSDDLGRYFKAIMWYGQVPFPLYKIENEERNVEQTLQALLITYSILNSEQSIKNWESIYEATNFFVGKSDDLGIYNYMDLLLKVYGNNPQVNSLADADKLDKLYEEAKLLPEPRIKPKYTSVTTPTGKQFRFMGQRYVLDADIIQELTEPIKRPIPSGLDVMGVLGSDRAKAIQLSKDENKHWIEYPNKFESLIKKFSKLNKKDWQSNMYQGWMWTLQGLNKQYKEGYPSFMTNEAWIDKNLNTALGSWSELKHDTILYGKQSGAEMGGGDLPRLGYVEPNIEVYERLLWLTRYSKENLKVRNLTTDSIDEKMLRFEELLEFLINCSVKELNNQLLTEDEYTQIAVYGGTLENLSSSFAGDGLRWFEITSETDKNMAIIADFHTVAPNEFSDGGYMEAGVGPAYEIYVVVPIDGKLYLTRGAVFSYHEFISNERLTDEKWQQIIKDNSQPPMPEWTNSFIREGKGEIPVPEY